MQQTIIRLENITVDQIVETMNAGVITPEECLELLKAKKQQLDHLAEYKQDQIDELEKELSELEAKQPKKTGLMSRLFGSKNKYVSEKEIDEAIIKLANRHRRISETIDTGFDMTCNAINTATNVANKVVDIAAATAKFGIGATAIVGTAGAKAVAKTAHKVNDKTYAKGVMYLNDERLEVLGREDLRNRFK